MTVLQRSTQHVVKQIQPGLWQIVFHFPATTTNCWLWQESDGLTLVDAGHPWNTKAILDAIKHVGHPLRRIVITHAGIYQKSGDSLFSLFTSDLNGPVSIHMFDCHFGGNS